MLVFVAIAGVVGIAQIQIEKPLVSQLPAPVARLSKPEPSELLTRHGLALTAMQRSAIQSISGEWSSERAKLQAVMRSFKPKAGRLDQISAGLQDYSELSRSYDTARSRYWLLALAQLDAKQKSLVAGGSK